MCSSRMRLKTPPMAVSGWIAAKAPLPGPSGCWTTHLPAHLRAHGPRIEPRDGVGCLMVEDTVVRRFSSLAKAGEQAKTFAQGASDPEGRLRDLDADGVWGEVMYPNLAFFCCFHI